MGQYDTDAWYLVILSDKTRYYQQTVPIFAWSKANAINKVFEIWDHNFYHIRDVYYCGQYKPERL